MPCIKVETNVPQAKIPSDFPIKLSNVIAKSLGKPLSYCVAIVTGGVSMTFGGTTEPCAYATLMSIGALGVNENKKHSKAIADCMSSIGVKPDRMYIHYIDAPSSVVGYNGSTFHDILG